MRPGLWKLSLPQRELRAMLGLISSIHLLSNHTVMNEWERHPSRYLGMILSSGLQVAHAQTNPSPVFSREIKSVCPIHIISIHSRFLNSLHSLNFTQLVSALLTSEDGVSSLIGHSVRIPLGWHSSADRNDKMWGLIANEETVDRSFP